MQSESIWGNINTCAEIALNVYMIYAEYGKGIMIPEGQTTALPQEILETGIKDKEGNIYFDEEMAQAPLTHILEEKLENGEITTGDIESFFEENEYGESVDFYIR